MRLGETLRISFAALALGAMATVAAAQETAPPARFLRTAREIRAVQPDEAMSGLAVDVTGVVTFVEPGRTIFFQDATGGTFSKIPKNFTPPPRGMQIRVLGKTYPGLYVPGIEPSRIELNGEAELPVPAVVTYEQLAAGERNYEWVEVRGVVRSVAASYEPERDVLLLSTGTGRLEVHVERGAAGETPAEEYVDAAVRIRGLAAGFINDRRQLVEPHLRVGSIRDVAIEQAPRPMEELPVMSAARLLRFSTGAGPKHRVRVRGLVTYLSAERLFLRDGDVGLMVQGRMPIGVVDPGAVVEARGFPAMGRFIAHLEDAVVEQVDRRDEPRPIRADLKTALTGAHDADLIELEAELREVVRARDGVTLLMRGGTVVFPARLEPGGAGVFSPPRIGSLLRLTGVCSVAQSASRATGFSTRPVAFDLLLRSPSDVRVVRAAPWWTARKLGLMALAALGLAALALAWAALLRRQVRRQTGVIAAQVQGEAVADERQRIAREFHDTLEQELVALSLRLDTAAAKASEGPVRGLLEGCRRLVQRLQGEGRDFIWDLREHSTAPGALRQALEEATGALCEGTETARTVSLEGEPRVLKGALAHALVRVAQEACSNAIRHGRARQVRIAVFFGDGEVRLRVEDEGAGFAVTDPPSAPPGHFGLLGMRERMQKAGGRLTVQSAPGEGTVVDAVVADRPVRAER